MSDSRAKEEHPVQETAAATLQRDSDKEDDGRSAKRAPELSLRVHLLLWINRMINLCKDLAIMLLVAFTYATLMNEPPKVTRSPSAYPFFSRNSTVRDYFRGQISLATEHARTADITFVMFYAPWDAESQTVRQPFEEAARLMQNRVIFAAVNCWQPGGECRNQYSKVYKWPVLIAYAVHSRGVQYNGPYHARYFLRFLNAVARPFVRVTTSEELDDLIANYDAAVVAYVNAAPGHYDYAVLYTAALKLLERDPFQEIPFAVCTVEKRERPIIELHMWNESWLYPEENEWQSEQIVAWIFKTLHQVTMWYMPSGMKSRQLATYLQPGPALILFSPKNPLMEYSDSYNMLREVGLEYYNCESSWRVSNTQIWLRKNRIENYVRHKEALKKCGALIKNISLVVTDFRRKWDNGSELETRRFCEDNYLVPDVCHKTNNCDCIFDEQLFCNAEITKTISDQGDRSADNLQRLWQEQKCRVLKLAQDYQPALFSQSVTDYVEHGKEFANLNISGLGCKTNMSLTFIAMDSLMQRDLAERLGIDISNRKDKTVAVIVNEKQEVHHIMEGQVDDFTLRQFVYNFTKHALNRALDNPKVTINMTCSESACIKELNTQNFLNSVMQQSKVVVVLYHSKQCFFCNGVSHVFLTVSNLLRVANFVDFASIDGDLNSLPWEYTMERYPTILLFPFYKKSESRVFPRNMPITAENLINFILANLDSNLRIPVMWALCSQTKFMDEREECTKDIRLETLSLVESNLKQWRKAGGRHKAGILRRLQLLKSLHLSLACLPQDDKHMHSLLRRIEVF